MISGGLSGCVCWFCSCSRTGWTELVLASPLPGESYLVDWLWFLGFVLLLYEPCFYPCFDTQAWLALVTKLMHGFAVAAQHTWAVCSHMLKLEPLVVLRFGLLLPLSCAVPGFGQAQVCGDSLHCPNWTLCYLLTVQTESLANTNILASVDSLFCRFEDGHDHEEILQVI